MMPWGGEQELLVQLPGGGRSSSISSVSSSGSGKILPALGLDPNPRNNIYPGVMYVGSEQMVLPILAPDPH